MKALLLAAGLGTRLQPLTNNIPKCLIEIDGKPLLEHWISMLHKGGVYPLLVNLHHHADKVASFVNNSPYREFVTTVFEEKLLGTGGTLLKNRDYFGNEPLMLVHADNLSVFDIQAFVNRHLNRPADCEITMMTFKTPTPHTCGIIETDEKSCVQAFHEKVSNPPGDMANGAVYIVEPSIFNYLKGLNKEFIDFSTEVIPYYMGRIYAFHNDVYHRDIGTIESYEMACQEFQKRILKMQQIDFHQSYCQKINQAVLQINLEKVCLMSDCLWDALQSKRQVFLCGNGGSAANAIHIANDFIYGIGKRSDAAMKVHALTANQSILTCLANDISYADVFSYQLEAFGQRDDILIALSGSGNSPNIVKAIETARNIGMRTFAILGYDGGRCLEIADNSIHIPINDMQISEDMQLVVGHMIMQWLRQRLLPNSGS